MCLAETIQLDALFPLTLALSLGERENHLAASVAVTIRRETQRRGTVFPLLGKRARVRGTVVFENRNASTGTPNALIPLKGWLKPNAGASPAQRNIRHGRARR